MAMKCPMCKGKGDHGTYNPHDPYWVALEPQDEFEAERVEDRNADPGVSLCDFCEGTGRLGALRRLSLWWDYRRSRTMNLWRDSRVYAALWRWFLCEWRARKLAAQHASVFPIWALAGHRRHRLSQFARSLEQLGESDDVRRFFRTEQRLVEEAERAAEIKTGALRA